MATLFRFLSTAILKRHAVIDSLSMERLIRSVYFLIIQRKSFLIVERRLNSSDHVTDTVATFMSSYSRFM